MDHEQSDRLKRVETHSNTLLEGQRRISEAVGELQEKMRNVLTELGGAPDTEYRDPKRQTIRDRMHNFDDFVTANTLAVEALKAAKAAQEQAQAQHEQTLAERHRTRWTRWQKIALFVFAAAAAFESGLRLFGVGG